MTFERVKKFITGIYKNDVVFGFAVLIGYFLQGRLWIFRGLYKYISTNVGYYGDAYYVMSIYLQNGLNLINGNLYSLQGDHYTWYSNIISATEHTLGPSVIFSALYEITSNPSLSLNLMYLSNIILLQFGMYLLIKYYTKNRIVSFFAGFFLPLSHALKMYYVGHIHSVMYWTLPFLILMIEKYFLNSDHKESIIKKSFVYLFTLFCFVWLLLAGWHIAIFSGICLVFYALLQSKKIYELFKSSKLKFVQLFSIVLIGIIVILPVAIRTLETSKVYRTTRSIGDVAYESRPITGLYGLSGIAFISLSMLKEQEIKQISEVSKSKISNIINDLNDQTPIQPFPDLVSSFSLMLYFILIIPFITYLIIEKKRPTKMFWLVSSSIFIFILSMGPYLKFTTGRIENIKMPYFYIYQIFFPLQAIRNINRIIFIGYFGLIIFWSILLAKGYDYFKNKNFIKGYHSIFGVVFLLLLAIITNFGWSGASVPQIEIDKDLQQAYSFINDRGESSSIYFLDEIGKDKYNNDSLGYNTSIFNFENRSRSINLVNGSIAGLYPYSTLLDTLEDSVVPAEIDLMVNIIAGKKVDYVISKNRDLKSELLAKLQNYYKLEFQNKNYSILSFQSSPLTTSRPDISLSIPSILNKDLKNYAYINFGNLTDYVWVNEYTVEAIDYKIEFEKDNKVEKTIKQKFGEEPFLAPEDGFSVEIDINKGFLEVGDYTINLYRNGQKQFSKDISVYNNKEWEEKEKGSRAVFDKYKDAQYGNFLEVNSFYASGKLEKDADGSNLYLDIIPALETIEGEAFPGFPSWFEPYECEIKGVYMKGDSFSKWCKYHQTGDRKYTVIKGLIR